jgi:hypothetical protein
VAESFEVPPHTIAVADARSVEGVLAGARPAIPRALPEPRTSDAWMHPVSFGSPNQSAVPASATWALSPRNPRWYGVSPPPSSTAMGVPTGFGVMAQVDVGKALGGL